MDTKQYFVLDYDFNLLPPSERNFPYELWEAVSGLFILVIDEKDAASVRGYVAKYPYIPKIYGIADITNDMNEAVDQQYTQVLAESGILQVQEEPLALSGQGVIIAIIDTGIQYEEAAFRYENGDTRILSIWDQTLEGEQYASPEGFAYGSEFDEQKLNQALKSDNPLAEVPTYDTSGHGSALAAIAAAGVQEDGSRGAAYLARFVIVKLRRAPEYLTSYYGVAGDEVCFADFDILMALRYVTQFQKPFEKPLVILLGMQTNQGSHTGDALLPVALGQIGKVRNQVVVVPAGNEGEAAGHYHGVIDETNRNGEVCELLIGEGEEKIVMELWGKPPALFSVGISSPAGEQIGNMLYRPGQSVRYEFLYSQTIVMIDYVATDQTSGQELIVIGLEKPIPGIWQIHVMPYGTYQEGVFDIWLPIRQFLKGDTRFLRPEPETTITEPAGGSGVISVGAYLSSNGRFYQKSSRGFLSDGEIKPDLVAPGDYVSAQFGLRTGTSYAAALLAGAGALFLEWSVVRGNERFVNTAVFKNILIRGATRNRYPFYPNPLYGYGEMNLEKSFDLLAGIRLF